MQHQNDNQAQTRPQPPSSTPVAFVNPEQGWVLNALNKMEGHILSVHRAVRVVNRKVENVDKKHNAAADTVKGWGDVPGQIADTKIFMAETKIRLENLDRHMVTKGQLAAYGFIGLLAILGAGWWVVQQYLAPLLAALPK